MVHDIELYIPDNNPLHGGWPLNIKFTYNLTKTVQRVIYQYLQNSVHVLHVKIHDIYSNGFSLNETNAIFIQMQQCNFDKRIN